MRYLDEYRDAAAARRLADALGRDTTRDRVVMEICGGQTHAILRFGIDRLLPERLTLVHGPGCPVCVTPVGLIDAAVEIAGRPGVILCSFGDMLRVPGSGIDLLAARARGADVRIVYSPADALRLARDNPGREIVFFAVGFETTAPANALVLRQARAAGAGNFSVIVSHMRVPPAIEAILGAPDNRVRGFLAAGHVCAVMGVDEYELLATRWRIPIVVAGFEPVDLLDALLECVRMLECGEVGVRNRYARVVRSAGNPGARRLIDEVFTPVDRHWRGLGVIPRGGLALAGAYTGFDALTRFGVRGDGPEPSGECIAGQVLRGVRRPDQCPAFGGRCTPEHPLGAPMVSSEGACAAYHRYRSAS